VKTITSGVLLLCLAALSAAAATKPAVVSSDPWSVLQSVRTSLADAGPVQASFTQTYVPAGFSSGEKESGRISLNLPDCLRWDYLDPTPKVFLLCGDMVHAWNTDDKTGRRYRINRANEPGLDLLLLGVDNLKGRYQATVASDHEKLAVSLSPRPSSGAANPQSEIADARLVVDPATHRIVEVSYHDREGNTTRFSIATYQPLPSSGQFSPPSGIEWEEP
jgi:outer membrane lipoprotein-sorting protein